MSDTLVERARWARRTVREQQEIEAQIAREVAAEGETRDAMAAEYERERIAANVAELRALGYRVESP